MSYPDAWPLDPQPHAQTSVRTELSRVSDPTLRVAGAVLDAQSRCVHYHGPLDVIAINMYCCRTYYPCVWCHAESTDHELLPWPREHFGTLAVLCGVCHHEMRIEEYQRVTGCPTCAAEFNPGCSLHSAYYFESDSTARSHLAHQLPPFLTEEI